MVMDVNYIYCDDHFTTYTNTKSIYCTLEANIMLKVNYTSIKRNFDCNIKKKKSRCWQHYRLKRIKWDSTSASKFHLECPSDLPSLNLKEQIRKQLYTLHPSPCSPAPSPDLAPARASPTEGSAQPSTRQAARAEAEKALISLRTSFAGCDFTGFRSLPRQTSPIGLPWVPYSNPTLTLLDFSSRSLLPPDTILYSIFLLLFITENKLYEGRNSVAVRVSPKTYIRAWHLVR